MPDKDDAKELVNLALVPVGYGINFGDGVDLRVGARRAHPQAYPVAGGIEVEVVYYFKLVFLRYGFLHWGFNYYIGDDIWHSACCPHKGALLPAGDAHIVYPGKDGRPWRSMRFEAQRAGAEDYELLMQAVDAAPGEADALIRTVCTTFRSYARSGAAVAAARLRLFRLLEEVARNG